MKGHLVELVCQIFVRLKPKLDRRLVNTFLGLDKAITKHDIATMVCY
jgi:hypothetical protein